MKAPHHEQEGWIYVRVRKVFDRRRWPGWLGEVRWPEEFTDVSHFYADDTQGSRVISSRRVEEAVECSDYRKRCDGEGIVAQYFKGRWSVWEPGHLTEPASTGATLREAYWRHKGGAQ